MLRAPLLAVLLGSFSLPTPVAQPGLEGCVGVLRGTAWAPAMDGESDTTELIWRECQVRCSAVVGCAHFTYFQNQSCRLHSVFATDRIVDSNAISGRPTCGASADFWNTDNSLATVTSGPYATSPLSSVGSGSPANMVLPPASQSPQIVQPVFIASPQTVGAREAEQPSSGSSTRGNGMAMAGISNAPFRAKTSRSSGGKVSPWMWLFVFIVVIGCCSVGAFLAYRKSNAEDENNEVTDEDTLGSPLKNSVKQARVKRSSILVDEEEVIYPDAQKIKWYPNIFKTPSIVDGLSKDGMRGSVETLISKTGTSQGGNTIPRPKDDVGERARRCKPGDTVEVYSKSRGEWLTCTVEKVELSRITVVLGNGNKERTLNTLTSDFKDNFRFV